MSFKALSPTKGFIMKAKKLISILLSLVMVLGALPLMAVTASAADVATTENFTYYYYEDFEGLSTGLESKEIAEALGWDKWDHSVATLKIVETIYMREFNDEMKKSETTKNLISQNASVLAGALKLTTGDTSEWADYRNIKTVDVAAIKSVNAFKDMDFTGYTSYSKKLLIAPVTDGANQNTSVVLTDNVDLGANAVFVDYELTPRFYDTLDRSNGATAERSYNSDSSVGITLANSSGKSVTQALMVNASFRYSYFDGENTTNSDITCKNWYETALGSLYQGGISLDYVAGSKYRTYKDGQSGCMFLADVNRLNGYRFTYRMKFTDGGFSSFVGNSAKATDLDITYMTSTNDAGKKGTLWASLSEYRNDTVTNGAKALMDGSTGTASLSVNHAGVAYYLDNIVVADHNSDLDDEVNSTAVTVKVNGADRKVLKDATIDVASLAPEGKQLVYATVGENVSPAGTALKLAEGLNITTASLGIDTRYGAAARLDTFTGLRWTTDVNKADFDTLAADANVSDIEVGTIITPTSYLESKAWGELSAEGDSPECLRLTTTASELVKSEVTNGNYTFAGSLVGIKTANYARAFSGVGYIKLTVNGTEVVLYGNYSDASHSRDVKTVAIKAASDVCTAAEKANLDVTVAAKYANEIAAGETYYDENGEAQTAAEKLYSRYTAEERDILKGFFVQ